MVHLDRRRRLLLLKKKVLLIQKKRKAKRKWWVRPSWRDRHTESEYFTTMQRMRNGDIEYFKKYYRMTPHQFDFLLSLLKEDLQRKHVVREPILPAERLAMTLRYLSSGDAMQDIALSFRVGISTARMAVRVTCRALWSRLQPLYMPKPETATWLKIAEGFGHTWQFPNCLGAVDGKHVHIKCPAKSGSMYFNYKGTYSIVLLAVVDSNYKFVVVDVGAYGKQSDGGVLEQSIFGQLLDKGKLQLPRDLPLPNTALPAPCVFIGDEAFQLRTDFLRPYPGRGLEASKRVFNYRLSRARRCVENAFGILVTRWRILGRPMGESPGNAEQVVKALCVLHNFLIDVRTGSDDFYCWPGYADSVSSSGQRQSGQWRQLLVQPPMQVARTTAHNFSHMARYVRDIYLQYFNSTAGRVSWQDAVI
ncbi:uncharacterized protein [Dermacentor albipictus]|uniref:uncharacterized protein n=2 Tax=Dermacentor albipictus TaxID=60249 RepID=UPI0031FDC950